MKLKNIRFRSRSLRSKGAFPDSHRTRAFSRCPVTMVILQVLVYFEVMADSSELHFVVEAMAFLFGIQVFTHG